MTFDGLASASKRPELLCPGRGGEMVGAMPLPATIRGIICEMRCRANGRMTGRIINKMIRK